MGRDTKKVVVCMTTFGLEWTKKALKSLFSISVGYPYDLILLDDMTTKESEDYLQQIEKMDIKKVFPQSNCEKVMVNLFEMQKGVVGCWNVALAITQKTDYICILNNDILFVEDWLKNLVDFMELNQDIGYVSPHWLETNYLENLQEIGRDYMRINEDKVEDGGWGWAFMLRKEMVNDIGDFDKRFYPANWEDIDYIRRIDESIWKVKIYHGSCLYHFGGKIVYDPKIEKQLGLRKSSEVSRRLFYKKWGLEKYLDRPFNVSRGRLYLTDTGEFV